MIRLALPSDIPAMHTIRMAVKENVLNTPGLVTENDYLQMLTEKGCGWVHEEEDTITGFAIVDIIAKNIWALFVSPEHEKKGIGKALHDTMLQWAFEQNIDHLWLTTDPNTRASNFYRRAGWAEAGMMGKELKFEYWFNRNPLSPII